MADATRASDLAVLFRIGAAWRELRRGASMQAFRPIVYGEGDDALDLGQVDALDMLVFHGSVRMGDLADALRVDASTATRGEPTRRCRPRLSRAIRRRRPGDGRRDHRARQRRAQGDDDAKARRPRGILADLNAKERLQLATLLERFIAGLDSYVATDT